MVVRDDLNEYEAMAARIADNKLAESEYDNDMLKFDLGTLQRQEDFDIKLTGMDLADIDKLMEDDLDDPDDDGEGPADENPPQFIVTVNCKDENEMQMVFEEMKQRGFTCKLIT